MYKVREVIRTDKQKILLLHRKVALRAGGIARSEEEISEQNIDEVKKQAAATGV